MVIRVASCILTFRTNPSADKSSLEAIERSLIIVFRLQDYVTFSAAADESLHLPSPANCSQVDGCLNVLLKQFLSSGEYPAP